MKKIIRNVAALNLCGATAESLAEISAIEDVALVLLTPRVRSLMQHIAVRDVVMVKEVPNSARMLMFNGELLLTADQLAQTCFLMVNGRLRLDESMTPELIDEKVASMSCKAAVKGNNRLSAQEVDALIGELLTLDNPYHCPHGRPTIIAMTKRELEKKFKRIV